MKPIRLYILLLLILVVTSTHSQISREERADYLPGAIKHCIKASKLKNPAVKNDDLVLKYCTCRYEYVAYTLSSYEYQTQLAKLINPVLKLADNHCDGNWWRY